VRARARTYYEKLKGKEKKRKKNKIKYEKNTRWDKREMQEMRPYQLQCCRSTLDRASQCPRGEGTSDQGG